MAEFNHLRKLDVKQGATSEYTFYRVQGRPTLRVRPAGEINKPYINAMFKKSKGIARRIRKGEMNAELLAETRDIDLVLYPQFVVVGWDETTVLDQDDNPAPYNVENVGKFLRALPPDMFDDLREHCNDLDNFREDDEIKDDDVEALAGN